jgi:hypothetical protein
MRGGQKRGRRNEGKRNSEEGRRVRVGKQGEQNIENVDEGFTYLVLQTPHVCQRTPRTEPQDGPVAPYQMKSIAHGEKQSRLQTSDGCLRLLPCC